MVLLQIIYLVNLLITEGFCLSCPMILYKKHFHMAVKYIDFLSCETACCGTDENRICCEKPEVQQPQIQQQHHNIGMYIGIGSACVVVIVSIISVTCCCITKHKKNMVVDIQPQQEGNRNIMFTGIDGSSARGQRTAGRSGHDQNSDNCGSPPPPYRSGNHPYSSCPPEYSGIQYSRSVGKVSFETGHM